MRFDNRLNKIEKVLDPQGEGLTVYLADYSMSNPCAVKDCPKATPEVSPGMKVYSCRFCKVRCDR